MLSLAVVMLNLAAAGTLAADGVADANGAGGVLTATARTNVMCRKYLMGPNLTER